MADFFPKITVQKHGCAKMRKHFKNFKASVFFQEKSKTTTLTRSKLPSHVLSRLVMCHDLLYGKVFARMEVEIVFDFPSAVSILIEIDMPLRSVSLIQESFI